MTIRQRFNADERDIIAHDVDVEVRNGQHWYAARLMTDGAHRDFWGRSFVNTTLSSGPHAGDYFRAHPGQLRRVQIEESST